MRDVHEHLLYDNGSSEPAYRGLFVTPLEINGVLRHVIVRMSQTHEGGMRTFFDPITNQVVGSCGCNFASTHVKTLSNWSEGRV